MEWNNCGKKRKGTSQRTCMNDPWTWTTVCGLTLEQNVGSVKEGKGGKMGQL